MTNLQTIRNVEDQKSVITFGVEEEEIKERGKRTEKNQEGVFAQLDSGRLR